MTIDTGELLTLYGAMARIRVAEEKIVERYGAQEMRCPVHLHIGQEAVPAGVACALQTTVSTGGEADRAFGSHRSHGPYLALGGDLVSFYAELHGRAGGCCGGRGGSMHLVDRDVGYWGSSAIVAGTIPIAVGSALASRQRGSQAVSVAFFGDGAVDEGAFTESLAFAALHRLGVLLVCENNAYATNSPQAARQACTDIAGRAAPVGAVGECVDGNDAVAVFEAAQRAVARGRAGLGPTLLECTTYRWKGHVGVLEDDRPAGELAEWRRRCPIARLRSRLASRVDEAVIEELHRDVSAEVDAAFETARMGPSPDVAEFLQGAHP